MEKMGELNPTGEYTLFVVLKIFNGNFIFNMLIIT